jgi:hypothetical protein
MDHTDRFCRQAEVPLVLGLRSYCLMMLTGILRTISKPLATS